MAMNGAAVALYIDPPSQHFLNDRLFDVFDNRPNGDRMNVPYARVREFFAAKGIPVHTADHLPRATSSGKNVYVSMGTLDNYRRVAQRPDTVLSAFFAMECPIVEPTLYRGLGEAEQYFKRIFSWSDAASLERFVGKRPQCHSFCWPQSFDDVHEEIWRRTDRKFLVMINGNKLPDLSWQELYTERLRALEYFSRWDEIDLYGVGWDGPPFRMGKSRLPGSVRRLQRYVVQQWQRVRPGPQAEMIRRVYHGLAASKAETLGNYTFAVCFENMVLKGWITEKIFDCFFAGTIPIYWGSPDIEERVPPECFIDMRRFRDYDDLRQYLKSLSAADVRQCKDNARAFLRSPAYRPFSAQSFVDVFARIVAEDTGIAPGLDGGAVSRA